MPIKEGAQSGDPCVLQARAAGYHTLLKPLISTGSFVPDKHTPSHNKLEVPYFSLIPGKILMWIPTSKLAVT